jgi:hypothetical protein
MPWLQWFDIPLKAVAVLLGGLWVLLNYYRGRTHKPHLQLRVFAERVLRDGDEYLMMKTELNNVGLSRVDVVNRGCMLTISSHRLPKNVDIVMEPRWEELANLELYKNQGWVEPSGLLIDSQVVPLPDLAGRFLRVWVHFETTTMALNSSVVVAPLAQAGLRNRNVADET